MSKRAVVITGTSRGLGHSLRQAAKARGLYVINVGRKPLQDLNPEKESFVFCDFSDRQATIACSEKLFSELVSSTEFKSIFLINNAATTEPIGKLGDVTTEALLSGLEVNLCAPLIFSQSYCRYLKEAKVEKRIVNISSGASRQAVPGLLVYSMAKAGMDAMTEGLANEYLQGRICSIAVYPGVLDTDMQTLLRGQSKATLPNVNLFKHFHDMNLLGKPDQVAELIVNKYLLGPVYAGAIYAKDFAPSSFRKFIELIRNRFFRSRLRLQENKLS